MLQTGVHYFLHFGLPLLISLIFFRKNWRRTYVIFLLTMLVDVDHLLSEPVFDADRCSIGYHPLHSIYAIAVYIFLLFFRYPLRIVGLGFLLHMITDFIDCMFLRSKCPQCLEDNSIFTYFLHLIIY